MAEVFDEEPKLLVALLLNTKRCIRMTPAETLRVEQLHLGRFRLPCPMKRTKQCRRGPERPMHSAFANVLKAFRQALPDERLRSEDQAIAFQLNLQVIAWRKPQLVVEFLRDGDLPVDANLDYRSRKIRSGLYFRIFIFCAYLSSRSSHLHAQMN
jgi:hypothetical protein